MERGKKEKRRKKERRGEEKKYEGKYHKREFSDKVQYKSTKKIYIIKKKKLITQHTLRISDDSIR